MSPLFPGRYSAQIDGSFVVFLIGMRINRLLAVHKWLPVARAMGPMVEHLLAHKELGLLHAQPFLYWRGAGLVQYWRSFEQLEHFARDPALNHLEPWKRFNRAVGADGSVGIWHETYQVQAGQYECVYGNMPPFGLAVAGQHLPAVGKRETARRRMGLQGEPAVPTYDNPPPPA
ncbi:MAG: DUF4188 domain-containing protein [Rhodoferax sp.]